MSAALDITRKARSNLAFALRIMPRDRRQDMVVFYAFCRTIDDLADHSELAEDERVRRLDYWENGLLHGFENPDEFQLEVVSLRNRQQIPNHLLLAIIDGCRMDLRPLRFQTWEELCGYIWKVACAVGLVSIRIFGCTSPGSERYAEVLGRALQLTNILRDVHEDFTNGQRIYLPMEDLARFQYTENDLRNKVRDDRFVALMNFEATRAENFYKEAITCLPVVDSSALMPAQIMGEIYQCLLVKMRKDQFRVFDKRYRISKVRKLVILSKHLVTPKHHTK